LTHSLPLLTDHEHARPALPARTILSHCPGSLVAWPLTFSATIAGNASPAQQRISCAPQLTLSCSSCSSRTLLIRYRCSRPLCGSCLVTSYNPPGAVQRSPRSGLNCTNCPTWNLCIWITAFSASMAPPPTACERKRTGIPEGRTRQRGRPGSRDRDGGFIGLATDSERAIRLTNCPHGAAVRSAGDCIDGRRHGDQSRLKPLLVRSTFDSCVEGSQQLRANSGSCQHGTYGSSPLEPQPDFSTDVRPINNREGKADVVKKASFPRVHLSPQAASRIGSLGRAARVLGAPDRRST
jgi:hypothetical protein